MAVSGALPPDRPPDLQDDRLRYGKSHVICCSRTHPFETNVREIRREYICQMTTGRGGR